MADSSKVAVDPSNCSYEGGTDSMQNLLELIELCGESEPNMPEIKRRVVANPEDLCPPILRFPDSQNITNNFPLNQAVNSGCQGKEGSVELIIYLIEEGMKLESMQSSKGGLKFRSTKTKRVPTPLDNLALRNEFTIFEYLANRNPPILEHADIHDTLCKCFYYDNRGAIPRLLEIFPNFLRDDMDLDCRGIERFVAHAAISFVETFQDVVEIGLRQMPDRDRGVVTGELLQILVSRRYFTGLHFLHNHEPPLLRPEDVSQFNLNDKLFALGRNGRTLSHGPAVVQIFQLLLELDPQMIAKRWMYHGSEAFPIHIFCEFMDEIEDESEFYGLLTMVLGLGEQYDVGAGCGGIFEPFNRTHPALKLYRFLGIGDSVERNVAMFQSALFHDTNELDSDTFMFLRDRIIPELLESLECALPIELLSRDALGRLPLHNYVNNNAVHCGSMNLLLKGDESAITQIDPVTGLLPALLAATSQEEGALSKVYMLFRRSPITP